MSKKHEFYVWVVLSEDGEEAVGITRELAIEAFEDSIGSAGGARVARILVKMALPVVAEAEVEIPDEAGDTVEVTAA